MNNIKQQLTGFLEQNGFDRTGEKFLCQFHDDHNPSGSIYESEGKWVFLPMEKQIEEYHRAMKALCSIGGEMLCTKSLTPEKVRLCHEYGVAVRPSAGHVKATNGERFLRMGVDGILGDDPRAVMACVKKVCGEAYVPRPCVTVAEIFRRNKE